MSLITKEIPAITLVGVGGIGTPLLPLLARLNPERITLWDDDIVGEENLTNQLLWQPRDVGKFKSIVAAQKLISAQTEVYAEVQRYVNQPLIDPIVIAAVDSLQSRRDLWRGVKDHREHVRLFIDGRLTREHPSYFQLFVIQLSDASSCSGYETWLEGEDVASSGRRDIDMVSAPYVLSGIIGTLVVQWSRGDCLSSIPWQVIWDGTSMTLMSFDQTS